MAALVGQEDVRLHDQEIEGSDRLHHRTGSCRDSILPATLSPWPEALRRRKAANDEAPRPSSRIGRELNCEHTRSPAGFGGLRFDLAGFRPSPRSRWRSSNGWLRVSGNRFEAAGTAREGSLGGKARRRSAGADLWSRWPYRATAEGNGIEAHLSQE